MERGVGEVFKGKDWNDMLGGFGEVHGGTSKNQLEGLNFGKSVASGNPKVTDFLRYSAEKLQSEDFTPKAAAKMKEQLQSDVNSSFQKHIDDIASQGIEKGDYTNTAQNILKAMDNYQNLFNDEKRGGAALGDIMKDTPEYERFNDGDSRIVLEAIAKSEFGKVLDERIKKLGSNPLKELAQIARGSENVKNALLNKMRDETKKEHLSWDDLADPNKTKKNGLVKKMVGGIVSNHLFRMVYNAATQEAQAKHLSPAQIKGKVMHDIGERLSNPHMKDENGVSWADLVKQDYEKSIADLNKRRAPGRSALIGGVAGGKAAQD
jgi:hypothetical protein